MRTERFFDDLARTLAEPMPRRRAVRVIGASLATVAIPAWSAKSAHAGIDQATCPDGSKCFTSTDICCQQKSPVSGGYVCRRPNEVCCCGNTACDPVTERCLCPAPGGAGGKCVERCELRGKNWKNCGVNCCQPHERCANAAQGKCVSCEDDGKQTCRSYDGQSSVICCPATRGSRSPCCANLRTTACCGPKQTCRAAGVTTATCECLPGAGTTCGSKCCGNGETCCDRTLCCGPRELCCDRECCDRATQYCYVVENVRGCVKKCNPPATKCGNYCCGPNTKCTKRKGKSVCV